MIETHDDTFSTLVGRCRWWGFPAHYPAFRELDHGNAEAKNSQAQIEKNLRPPPKNKIAVDVSEIPENSPIEVGKLKSHDFSRVWGYIQTVVCWDFRKL